MQALHIAEAGIELAIWEVAYGGQVFAPALGWSGTGVPLDPWVKTDTINKTVSYAGNIIVDTSMGEYYIVVEAMGNEVYEISSHGFFPDQANSISDRTVKVAIKEEKLFQQAVFSVEEMLIGNNAVVDSYDSTLGV